MEDKLDLPLDELIKKQKQENKGKGKPKGKFQGERDNQNRNKKMTQREKSVKAPNAWEKASKLRRQKVQQYGPDRRDQEPFTNGKKFTSKSKRDRGDDRPSSRGYEESKETKQSSKLKVMNLSNSISNEDLNVLFRNIGPLKEWRREYDEFGRQLGSAIVTYEKVEDALKAHEDYNGGELDGNVLVINFLANNSRDSKSGKASQPRKLQLVHEDGKKVIKKF